MSDCVKALDSFEAVNPKTLLSRLLEVSVVAFRFRSRCVNLLKRNAISVNRQSVFIGNDNVFSATAVILAAIPILVIAWETACF